MDAQIVEHLLNHRPFYPLRLHMTDRHVVEVHRPEFAKVGESVLTLYEPDAANPGQLRMTCLLSLDHVVSLEQVMPDEPTIVGNP